MNFYLNTSWGRIKRAFSIRNSNFEWNFFVWKVDWASINAIEKECNWMTLSTSVHFFQLIWVTENGIKTNKAYFEVGVKMSNKTLLKVRRNHFIKMWVKNNYGRLQHQKNFLIPNLSLKNWPYRALITSFMEKLTLGQFLWKLKKQYLCTEMISEHFQSAMHCIHNRFHCWSLLLWKHFYKKGQVAAPVLCNKPTVILDSMLCRPLCDMLHCHCKQPAYENEDQVQQGNSGTSILKQNV